MRLKTLVALAFVFLSLSLPAAAAFPPVPAGPEFRVNTSTGISQDSPSITAFPDGGFVVVWSGSGARARFLNSAGRPVGREFRLAGVGGGVDQVVADRDGSFLVAWTGVLPDTPGSIIFVRRFNRDGTPRGKRIRASLPSTSYRYSAVAAVGPDGRFAVAWVSEVPVPEFQDGRYTNAVGRIFSAQGTPLTPEIILHAGEPPTRAGDDTIYAFPSSLALKPSGALAALVQETGGCLQSFLAEVPPPGGASRLQSLGSGSCGFRVSDGLEASLAMGKDGSLVATWSDYDVQAQRFAPDGTRRGQGFFLSSEPVSNQFEPAAALQAGGQFVVAWTEEDRDGDGRGIFGRAFAANGTARTPVFRINTTTAGNQYDPAIAAPRQGPAVVVWTQSLVANGRTDIFARVLSPNR
ncbi:MAG TPA: hypothetical protein VGS22_24055 [Thermoanaerobaculia bacterium]|nr:hypothetical protein [Thermoanaerobaculia bacterium]